MFTSDIYIRRRQTLKKKMAAYFPEGKRGIGLFLGNVEAPAQYRDNCYKWRQDSSWLYFFGIDEPGYAAIIDFDSGEETVFADDLSMDDLIWTGPQPSVQSIAETAGVHKSAPSSALTDLISKAKSAGRRIHFLPPSRYYGILKLSELCGCSHSEVLEVKPGEGRHASKELVEAVISMRLVKEQCEIEQIDDAGALGQEMHTIARNNIHIGARERDIVGNMEAITLAKGWGVSFPTILTQHGETLHNHLHDGIVEPGRLMVIDAGAENDMHYASDFTRTYPTGGKFTTKQRDVYQIVCDCNEYAFSLIRPGIAYRDVHIAVAGKMLEGLQALGIVKGDVEEMVAEGIAGLFQPHGLGHNMGLDVHDMEDLGEDLVGYDPDQRRSPQLGLGSLRMARRLKPGNVITDEPGIYFIPALIELWKKEGTGKGFVNYAKLEKEYYDFGGIRLEDDVLVTEDGARRTGPHRLPIQPSDVEDAMIGK